MKIEVHNIVKRFGTFTALHGVNLTIPEGELVALLGPSGSGKTSLLRIIAGLEGADEGQVLFDGEDASRWQPRDRQVGFVFQHYALFRHMTVFENVAFGLRVRPRATRPPEAEIKETVMGLLGLVQLDWLADQHPSQLSGGQRQRVALARALAVKPSVLLLDEPFGALDAKVRKELRRWLRRLHDEVHVTSVFVTHDQDEAMEVADQVVVMNEGRIEQIGTPSQVYEHPATPFVYGFLGDVNLFHGRVHEGRLRIGETELEAPEFAGLEEQAALAFVRTHELEITPAGHGPAAGGIEAKITHHRQFGSAIRIELERAEGGQAIEVEMNSARFQLLKLRKGDRVVVSFTRARVFPHDGDSAPPPVSA